tara:strand:- start:757 stop:906 length:150 start_codon:yes stop_codon:yes gene_type:complete
MLYLLCSILILSIIVFLVRKQEEVISEVDKKVISCECPELQTWHPGRVE